MLVVSPDGQGGGGLRSVFRAPGRISSILFFCALGLVCSGLAVYGFSKGYAPLGSHSPGAAAALAAGSVVYACDLWRRGLFVEARGIKLVRPWRLHAVHVDWDDIARFEMHTAAGQWPVSLIRASDQRRIPVPTFSKPRKDISGYATLPVKVQAQVDELNGLLEQHVNTLDAR
jgi:hypothetical protein